MFEIKEKEVVRYLVCHSCGGDMTIRWRFCPFCGEGMWNEDDPTQRKAREEYMERYKGDRR